MSEEILKFIQVNGTFGKRRIPNPEHPENKSKKTIAEVDRDRVAQDAANVPQGRRPDGHSYGSIGSYTPMSDEKPGGSMKNILKSKRAKKASIRKRKTSRRSNKRRRSTKK